MDFTWDLDLEVKLAKRDLVIAGLTKAGQTYEPEEATLTLTIRLLEHFKTMPKEALVKCDTCGGIGPFEWDNCPFCGAQEGTPLNELESKEAMMSKATESKVTETKSDASKNGAAADDKKAKKGKPKTSVSVQIPLAEPMPSAAEVQPSETSLAVVDPHANAIEKQEVVDATFVDDTHVSSAMTTVHDLDSAVSDIHRLKGEGALACYRLGKKIQEIHEKQLWKLRTEKDDKGRDKGRWQTFEAFCNEELGISPSYAYRLRDVSSHYSEEQVLAHGTRKLSLLLEMPAEHRDRVMEEKVKAGATKAEIEKEVSRVKQETGHRAIGKGRVAKAHEALREKAKTKAAAAKKAPKEATITVANILGTQTIKLFCKPARTPKTSEDWKNLKRAKRLGDQPFGSMDLANDVVMYFAIMEDASGELKLKVSTQRVETEE